MRLLTAHSESHQVLFDLFLKSLDLFVSDDFTLVSGDLDQKCQLGTYMSTGFAKTTTDKFTHIYNSIDSFDNEICLCSDVDVVILGDFIDDINEEMHGFDMKFQKDGGQYCTGFFSFRRNKLVKDLIGDCIQMSIRSNVHDQTSLNQSIHKKGLNISHGLLNTEKYVNPPLHNIDTKPLDDVISYHANFVVGVDRKKKLMERVIELKVNESD